MQEQPQITSDYIDLDLKVSLPPPPRKSVSPTCNELPSSSCDNRPWSASCTDSPGFDLKWAVWGCGAVLWPAPKPALAWPALHLDPPLSCPSVTTPVNCWSARGASSHLCSSSEAHGSTAAFARLEYGLRQWIMRSAALDPQQDWAVNVLNCPARHGGL